MTKAASTVEFTTEDYFAGLKRLRWVTILMMGGVCAIFFYIGYSHGGVVYNKLDAFTHLSLMLAILSVTGTIVLKSFWKKRLGKIRSLDEKLASIQTFIVLNYALISFPVLLASQMFVPSHSSYLPIISLACWLLLIPPRAKYVRLFLDEKEAADLKNRTAFKVTRKK